MLAQEARDRQMAIAMMIFFMRVFLLVGSSRLTHLQTTVYTKSRTMHLTQQGKSE
ncbi:hypothetical protein BRC2024_HCTLARHO_CDS_0102 [Acinetobacter phage vB_AbaS_Silvergun]